ncbi:MAG: serine acetyltransferase [Planctomycetota bacterium]
MITWSETRARLREDRLELAKYLDLQPGRRPMFLILNPSYQCMLLHRISFYFFQRGYRFVGRFFWHLNLLVTGADISPISDIGGGMVVNYPLCVGVIGKVGKRCVVHGHVGIGGGFTRDDIGAGPGLPVVGDDVVLDSGALVLGSIRIGNRSRIGARTVVTRDVPEGFEVVPTEPALRIRKVDAL